MTLHAKATKPSDAVSIEEKFTLNGVRRNPVTAPTCIASIEFHNEMQHLY